MSTIFFISRSELKQFTDEVLVEAAVSARKKVGQALFVSEHRQDRADALKAGFDAAIPHPSLAPEIIEGQTLVYARVSGLDGDYRDGRKTRLLNLPAIPVHVTPEENGTAYLITSTRIAEVIRRMGLDITTFDQRHDPQTTDLYLVRDDRDVPEGVTREQFSRKFLAEERKEDFVVTAADDALLLAIPRDVSIREIHFLNPLHGHNWRLLPDQALMEVPDQIELADLAIALTGTEVDALKNGIRGERIKHFYAPYVGLAPLVVGGASLNIKSRDIEHNDNRTATMALLEQLNAIGDGFLTVTPREFYVGGGQTLINVEADLPGSEPTSIVIISAHLDSIALDAAGAYHAPGGDDDASGMAGVLAAAEVIVKLRRENGQFKRTLRFAFFNAEEDGVTGSLKYAAEQRKDKVQIVGVFQMDMIGFHGGIPTVFEIHAGYSHLPNIEKESLLLAELVRDVAKTLSPSLVSEIAPRSPQIYPRDNESDPAQGRSDHTRFHQYRYPACMISEDHFTDPGDPSPDPQYNPAYHQSTDLTIDFSYAAEIARAVAGAAIVRAKS